MIEPAAYFECLAKHGIHFFAGVPDSLLKDFCAYVTDHAEPSRDVIAANEGAAIALATGHHLGTGDLALVYMQNSGLGNTINPLTSLTDPEVYRVPMLLMVGWRGEPGEPDEPQHVKQGRVTLATLDALEIPYLIHPENLEEAEAALAQAIQQARTDSTPVALVVRAGTFAPYALQNKRPDQFEMKREQAVAGVAEGLSSEDIIVSTTGKTSRELFEHRAARGESHAGDFLTVGSMGHASQIALGIALSQPERQIVCLDGDGALIMHMGSLAVSGTRGTPNFKHIVVNNGAHDSVGGQSTAGYEIDLPGIARACGYREARCVESAAEMPDALTWLRAAEGPVLLEIRVDKGARSDLGRPTTTPNENKRALMKKLGATPTS
ncbi:MAG: phosphonopyruvate decarboxylase [Myxococcota bacterium]